MCSAKNYSAAEWRAEDVALKQGSDPQPCPWCKRRGFYAPRLADGDRKYRVCKFCGTSQDVGKDPCKLIRYECQHPDGSEVADWKRRGEPWVCPITGCGREYGPEESVSWPNDDLGHWWGTAPESGTQADYEAFWRRSGVDPPPHFGIP